MERQKAISSNAAQAYEMLVAIQHRFASNLTSVGQCLGKGAAFVPVEWFRDEGVHGGGVRLEAPAGDIFNRGSVNFSQVHYDDLPDKTLGSATALSTIIHPLNPNAPSIHIHISWTEMKKGDGYWRVMADLNPSLECHEAKAVFIDCLKKAGGPYYDSAMEQGEQYFNIPALGRHRGVAHFYLEEFSTQDFDADLRYCESFGKAVVDLYPEIIRDQILANPKWDESQSQQQIDYHTLYFFQVLTLDRGTTAGLMIHNQNDVGIMGSIPSHINLDLLKKWHKNLPKPQDQLLESLISVSGGQGIVEIDAAAKARLAAAVREHYKKFPEALSMQATGKITPKTVANHA